MKIIASKISTNDLWQLLRKYDLDWYLGPAGIFEYAPQRENFDSDEQYEDACKQYMLSVLAERTPHA